MEKWRMLRRRKRTRTACATTQGAEMRAVVRRVRSHIDQAKLATAAEEEDGGKVNVEEGVGMRMNTMALERTRKMRTSAGTYEHWPEEKVDHQPEVERGGCKGKTTEGGHDVGNRVRATRRDPGPKVPPALWAYEVQGTCFRI